MVRVERPSIRANIGPEPTQLEKSLRAVVTPFAERLERTEPEFVDVAAMRLDMVADLRRRNDAALETECA
jgi:hypothetical protein